MDKGVGEHQKVRPVAFTMEIRGNMGSCMKTTIELPDALLIAAKKRAIETRTTSANW